MSDFDYQPMNGAQTENDPRVLAARFGDGYEQRVADGINNDLEKWPLTFVDTKANIDLIRDFIKAKGGVESFTWTPDGYDEIRVVCRRWSRAFISKVGHTFSCTFEQVPE
jgi:phage-related protein